MERLTFEGNFCDIAVCLEQTCPYKETGCTQRQVWERLKAYENTGYTPEEIDSYITRRAMKTAAKKLGTTPARLRELVEADHGKA